MPKLERFLLCYVKETSSITRNDLKFFSVCIPSSCPSYVSIIHHHETWKKYEVCESSVTNIFFDIIAPSHNDIFSVRVNYYCEHQLFI